MADAGWAAYLTAAQANAGMRDADLSRRTGINSGVIARWKTGNKPSLDNLRRLAPVLGVPLLDLAVVAGHLTPEEAGREDVPAPPERVEPVNPREQLIRDAGLPDDVTAEWIERDREEFELLRTRIARLRANTDSPIAREQSRSNTEAG